MDDHRQPAGLGLIGTGLLWLLGSWWIGGPAAPLVGVATVGVLAAGVVLFGTAGDHDPVGD